MHVQHSATGIQGYSSHKISLSPLRIMDAGSTEQDPRGGRGPLGSSRCRCCQLVVEERNGASLLVRRSTDHEEDDVLRPGRRSQSHI